MNRVYQWNMQKNYSINIFDYEGHNPWDKQYNVKEAILYNKVCLNKDYIILVLNTWKWVSFI